MINLYNIDEIDLGNTVEETTNNVLMNAVEDDAIYSTMGNVKEENGCYWRLTNEGGKVISNFIIEPVELVVSENVSEFNVRIILTNNKICEKKFYTSDFISSSRFKSVLCQSSIDIIFRGKDEDLDGIRDILNQKKYHIKKGINYTGIIEHNKEFIFVSKSGTIDANNKKVDDVVYFGDTATFLDTKIVEQEPIWEPELAEIGKKLFNFNDLSVTATIIGFCASCFLKEKLAIMNGTKLNHLIICGESGSGKSETLENIIMPIFNLKSSTSAAQCTKFVTTRFPSASNTIPFIINEYKPAELSNEIKKNISNLLNNGYDKTSSYRGRPDQKLNEYQMLTPIIMAGEMQPGHTSAIQRSLIVYFAHSKTYKNPESEENFKYLKANKDLLNRLGRSLLEEALKIDMEILMERQRMLLNKIDGSMSSRPVSSAVNCMLGILLLEDVFSSMCFDFKETTGYTTEELFEAILNTVITDVLDGKKVINGIIEDCFEILNDIIENGILRRGIDYQIINAGTELALDINELYPKFIKYKNAQCLSDLEILSVKQFKKQLELKEYYIEKNRAVAFNSGLNTKRKKAFVLNLLKLKEKNILSNLYN